MSSDADPGPTGHPVFSILREFVEYLRRPRLIEPRWPQNGREAAQLATLVVFDILVAASLLPLLVWWQKQMGLPDPASLDALGPVMALALGAVLVPAAEETVMRGWLSGRPRTAALIGIALAWVAAMFAIALTGFAGTTRLALFGAAILIAIAALFVAWRRLRSRPAATGGTFERYFPWLFWAQAIVFGAAHLSNYVDVSPLLALPMVLPQFAAGLILGFTRMRFGLPASILVHGTANALFIALTLTGS